MTDSRFFTVSAPMTLGQLAGIADAEAAGACDPERIFHGVAPLAEAGADEVSFLDNRLYVEAFCVSRAGACIVRPEMAARAPAGMALLLSKDPYRGYAKIATAFYPEAPAEAAVGQGAAVDPSAEIGADVAIGPGVVIGAGAVIADGCRIGANTVVGPGVVVGGDSRIGPQVTLACCLIGRRAVIHAGVRIGQDGFGFAIGPGGHLKVPQLGRVVIGDDVEIGANTTIDRGTGPDTEIGDGTKIDNLVQIGHNVRVGRNCVIVSQVGISGSTTLGDFVMLGGQAGLAGHLEIGSGAQVAAQSGLMRPVAPGQKVGGSPALPFRDWMRANAAIEKLGKKKGD